MRKASNNFSIIKDENQFYGISLGYDYCAEHEWGIEKMRRDFGIGAHSQPSGLIDKAKKALGFGSDVLGISNRLITKHDSLSFKKEGQMAMLTNHVPWRPKEDAKIKDLLPHDLSHCIGKDLATAWDEEHFFILVSGEDNIKYLEDLYEQFKKNNIAITRINSSLPVFENASLSILIADRLPQESLDGMYNVDKEAKDLVDYEAEIGMAKLKEDKKAGYHKENYYMACSPRWINYEDVEAREKAKEKAGTKYDIQYWINYSDDDNNYGWYTVEEIKKWLSTDGLKLTQIRKAHS